MEDGIGKLKAVMPALKTVIYSQGNAGAYRSGATIIGASKAGQFQGVTVKRLFRPPSLKRCMRQEGGNHQGPYENSPQ